jgi:hypothetical protein
VTLAASTDFTIKPQAADRYQKQAAKEDDYDDDFE